MVVKKQLRKISKKIIILGLATSIIFTSCFSTKKIEVKAMGAVVTALSAWTMYDICLAIGAVAVPALGIGYAYSNRDEIAEFGKTVINSMVSNELENPDSWLFGTYNDNGSVVYDGEALVQIASQTWDFIKEGGLTPATAEDLNGDGFVDVSDKDFELANSNFWTTSDGAEYIYSQLQSIYDSWVNKEEDNILDSQYGAVNTLYYEGVLPKNVDGKYVCNTYIRIGSEVYDFHISSPYHIGVGFIQGKLSDGSPLVNIRIQPFWYGLEGITVILNGKEVKSQPYSYQMLADLFLSGDYEIYSDCPIFTTQSAYDAFLTPDKLIDINALYNSSPKSYRVADWMDSEGQWMDTLDELTITLRSLQDMVDISSQVCSTALELTPTADIYRDLVADVVGTYNPVIDVVIPSPIPWNPDITRPVTSTDLPRDVVTDTDIPMPDGPNQDDNDEDNDFDIDLPTLSIMFDIIYLMVMIVVMLLLVFLACLGFIVMIFRIPASSSMLPEDMVLGFEHLKTIMIPGFNISIFDFAMALIYLFIVFTVIKIIRLEINDYGIPKSRKGG